mmetsp:Transcript_17323/g.52717  ORF Transcript_17323/g.52717 Transcript_17323/m.52717 type:complete len:267 (-) Transcript_17323:2263-3063(-)
MPVCRRGWRGTGTLSMIFERRSVVDELWRRSGGTPPALIERLRGAREERRSAERTASRAPRSTFKNSFKPPPRFLAAGWSFVGVSEGLSAEGSAVASSMRFMRKASWSRVCWMRVRDSVTLAANPGGATSDGQFPNGRLIPPYVPFPGVRSRPSSAGSSFFLVGSAYSDSKTSLRRLTATARNFSTTSGIDDSASKRCTWSTSYSAVGVVATAVASYRAISDSATSSPNTSPGPILTTCFFLSSSSSFAEDDDDAIDARSASSSSE